MLAGRSRALTRAAAFLAMATVWGVTWISARWATDAAPPIFVAAIRLIAACLCFLAWCLLAKHALAVAMTGRLVVASLLINTGCYSFLFWGLTQTPTGLAAIVNMSLIPVFSMLIGALHGEEQVTPRRLAAVALGALGLTLLFSTRGPGDAEAGGQVGLGLAAIVVSTLSYCWGAIVSKPLVRAMPPVAVAFWETLIGGVSLVAVSLLIEGYDPARLAALASGKPLAGLAFLVVGGSLVGLSVYLWLLREWGAFRASLYAFLSPAIAVGIGVAFLGERFGWWDALGMAVMFGAAALALGPARAGRRPVSGS